MEKSWNMKNWPNVMEFYDQSWNFTNFAAELYLISIFLVTTKKLSSDLESLRFPQTLRMQNREEKWSWKSYGKMCCQVCEYHASTSGSQGTVDICV